jgi:hypothetical protein
MWCHIQLGKSVSNKPSYIIRSRCNYKATKNSYDAVTHFPRMRPCRLRNLHSLLPTHWWCGSRVLMATKWNRVIDYVKYGYAEARKGENEDHGREMPNNVHRLKVA